MIRNHAWLVSFSSFSLIFSLKIHYFCSKPKLNVRFVTSPQNCVKWLIIQENLSKIMSDRKVFGQHVCSFFTYQKVLLRGIARKQRPTLRNRCHRFADIFTVGRPNISRKKPKISAQTDKPVWRYSEHNYWGLGHFWCTLQCNIFQ